VGKQQLIECGWLTEDELSDWEEAAKLEVQTAVTTAQKENEPDPYTEDWCALARGSYRDW
jgi:pyruvate dehydrogenase E1 component alpha subunit/2-oxoisovalerate dehydrogenase E1 component alpha subunit